MGTGTLHTLHTHCSICGVGLSFTMTLQEFEMWANNSTVICGVCEEFLGDDDSEED